MARCEVQAATALQASSHCFFQHMLYEFSLEDERSRLHTAPLKIAWYAYRQDATNGRDKYSTMLLDAAFVNLDVGVNAHVDAESHHDTDDPDAKNTFIKWWDTATTISRTSDILPIDDETGRGCFAFSHKAFASLGCPTPADYYEWSKTPVLQDTKQPQTLSPGKTSFVLDGLTLCFFLGGGMGGGAVDGEGSGRRREQRNNIRVKRIKLDLPT